jgi:tetratricopeptide (TPR) repeat protein
MRAMRKDRYRLTVTTASSEALDAYNDGVDGVLAWHRDTIPFFQTAVARDPDFALAHAGLAVGLFVEDRFAEARASMQRARSLAPRASARERSQIEALDHYVEIDMAAAEAAMREHLAAYPIDLLVAQRLYFIWFFQGRFEEMLRLTGGLLPRLPNTSFVLGLHAFALEELGRCDEARSAAEACIARNPQDTWGVHSLVHALYEMGGSDQGEGLRRVPPALAACTNANYYRNHLLWHLILMHLARGDYARASEMTHDVFEREPTSVALDLRNAVSVLWRFELCGMSPKARWEPFVAIARRLMDRREDLPFHHPHLAMVLAGGGDWAAAERHLDLLRARVPNDRSGVLKAVAIPLIEGIHAFCGRDWWRVIEKLEPIRSRIIELGGSRAQRDAFHDTLFEACFRAGDVERAERFLAERLARRPDHFWLNRKRVA